MKFLLLASLLAACISAGCGSRSTRETPNASNSHEIPAPPLTHTTLALNWFPEMEHGGFYSAEINGYYKQAGLDVEIIPGGAGTQVIPQVAAGRAEFGVENADNLILARAQGIPVIAILAPIQKSPRCLIVHEKSGIASLGQLKNVTLAMNVANPFAVFLQKRFPLEGVRVVPYQGNTAQFLLDPNYAQQGYLFSEPYIIKSKGGDPRSLLLADAGFNPYTSMLITTRQTISERPELARALANASAQGWVDYAQRPQPANDHIHQLNLQLGLDVLEYGAQTLREMVQTSETRHLGVGCMTRARWADLIGKMEQVGLVIHGAIVPDDCFVSFHPAKN